MWLILLVTLLAAWYAYFRIRYRHKYRLAASFAGPAVFPFIGSIWRFMNIPPEGRLVVNIDRCKPMAGMSFLQPIVASR